MAAMEKKRKASPQESTLIELDEELTAELRGRQDDVLARVAERLGKADPPSVHSWHGTIGGKNNTYVDAVRTQFLIFNDFFAGWLHGLRKRADEDVAAQHQRSGKVTYATAALRLCSLLKDGLLRAYVSTFLERNFYRNLRERTRFKPDDELWRVWFGENKSPWGLLIAPIHAGGEWINDKSEIRRAPYDYWTVGHVLHEGLVDPSKDKVFRFNDLDSLVAFCESVIKRSSSSLYEHGIMDRYIDYVRRSKNPESEPFLIPEFRYAGLETKHKYRLDFTVLNAHVASFCGFELSPASTHMAVKGAKDKTQKKLNEELAEKWAAECEKRNDYFAKFEIPVVTFTGERLRDLDRCFLSVEEALKERPLEKLTPASEFEEIDKYEVPDLA